MSPTNHSMDLAHVTSRAPISVELSRNLMTSSTKFTSPSCSWYGLRTKTEQQKSWQLWFCSILSKQRRRRVITGLSNSLASTQSHYQRPELVDESRSLRWPWTLGRAFCWPFASQVRPCYIPLFLGPLNLAFLWTPFKFCEFVINYLHRFFVASDLL